MKIASANTSIRIDSIQLFWHTWKKLIFIMISTWDFSCLTWNKQLKQQFNSCISQFSTFLAFLSNTLLSDIGGFIGYHLRIEIRGRFDGLWFTMFAHKRSSKKFKRFTLHYPLILSKCHGWWIRATPFHGGLGPLHSMVD